MPPSLYIIDGHAQIYAAYYAPLRSNLMSPDGEPTKATYIVTTILLKIIREKKPDYLAVAMDAKGKTFRHELYEQYKANRPPMPEDLPVQIERIDEILNALNIPIFRVPGYEADDLIGTLSRQGREKGLDVVICSKDKDLEQLIAPGVVMYDPQRDTITDLEGLYEKKGITPEQVPDILALQGDTSDNIPGVPDVGPKTACQWIQQYGSLDKLIENQGEIKGKRGESLRNNIEQLHLSRELATINVDSPFEVDWEAMRFTPIGIDRLEPIFEKLNFQKLLKQLDPDKADGGKTGSGASGSGKSGSGKNASDTSSSSGSLFGDEDGGEGGAAVDGDYRIVNTVEQFEGFLAELKKQKVFAIDTETTGLNPVTSELVGMSFSWKAGQGYYIPVKGPLGQATLDEGELRQGLGPILANDEIKKVGQNIKYDLIVLEQAGYELNGIDFDTMIASYLLDSGRSRHNMDSLAADYLEHETIKLETLIGKGKKQITFDQVDLELAVDYAAEDADVTWQLYKLFDKRLGNSELRKLFTEVEMPLVGVLASMERRGVTLDIPLLQKISGQLSDRLDELVASIHKEAGTTFNVDSPKQLGEVLFDKLGLEPVKKTKGGASGNKTKSTDQEVLETLQWQHPVPAMMLEYRQLAKLKNTYIDKLPTLAAAKTNRIHASFNQTVAATGRLSSSNPNMQNIPIRTEQGQEIRRAFIPGAKDYVILAADYSQIELRFMAHFSGDEGLIQAFQEDQDIHRFVASQVYGVGLDEVEADQRSRAKAVNFGIIYGQTAYGLSRSIGVPVNQAQQFIDEYFARYPRIREFIDSTVGQARKDQFVKTILGRRRNLPDINARNFTQRSLAERMAVNTVIQGSAADMIKIAMINLQHRIEKEELELFMLLQVHDELVFELPESMAESYAEIIREEMTGALSLEVPMRVDMGWGENWLACK